MVYWPFLKFQDSSVQNDNVLFCLPFTFWSLLLLLFSILKNHVHFLWKDGEWLLVCHGIDVPSIFLWYVLIKQSHILWHPPAPLYHNPIHSISNLCNSSHWWLEAICIPVSVITKHSGRNPTKTSVISAQDTTSQAANRSYSRCLPEDINHCYLQKLSWGRSWPSIGLSWLLGVLWMFLRSLILEWVALINSCMFVVCWKQM